MYACCKYLDATERLQPPANGWSLWPTALLGRSEHVVSGQTCGLPDLLQMATMKALHDMAGILAPAVSGQAQIGRSAWSR